MAHHGRLHSRRHANQRREQVAAWYGKNRMVTCVRCNQTGYKPDLPEHPAIKQHYKPMSLDENGVCEVCRGL